MWVAMRFGVVRNERLEVVTQQVAQAVRSSWDDVSWEGHVALKDPRQQEKLHAIGRPKIVFHSLAKS